MQTVHPVYRVRPPAFSNDWRGLGLGVEKGSTLAANIAKGRGGYLHHRILYEFCKSVRVYEPQYDVSLAADPHLPFDLVFWNFFERTELRAPGVHLSKLF